MNAICIFDPLSSTNKFKISGYVEFHQCCKSDPVNVTINLSGFKPNSTHAFHIHEFADIRDCRSCGPHYNPYNKLHGNNFDDHLNHHAGDLLNNLTSDSKGNVSISFKDNLISLFPKYQTFDTIIGRSLVLHEGTDDLGRGNNKESKITGNAGGRMACFVIGLDKPHHF